MTLEMGPSILKLPSSIFIILYNGSGGIPVANLTARNTSLSLPGTYEPMRVPVHVQNSITRYKKHDTVEANVSFSGVLYQQREVCKISHIQPDILHLKIITPSHVRQSGHGLQKYVRIDTCVLSFCSEFYYTDGLDKQFLFSAFFGHVEFGHRVWLL